MDYKKIKQLREERGALLKSMEALIAKPETEKRSMNETETAEFDGLHTRSENMLKDLERHEKLFASLGQGLEARSQTDPTAALLEIPGDDQKHYSLLRALNKRANGEQLDGIEREL